MINEWDCNREPIQVFITDFGTTRDVKKETGGAFVSHETKVAGSLFMYGEPG